MASSRLLWLVAAGVPQAFPGWLIHRAALWATWDRAYGTADRLFEAAAARYRAELRLVPLARVRAHQWMARGQAGIAAGGDPQAILEVERRLVRLDAIEEPRPPFALVAASSLLAAWLDARPAPAGEVIEGSFGPSETRLAA